MFLAIDVGNSDTVVALYRHGVRPESLVRTGRFATHGSSSHPGADESLIAWLGPPQGVELQAVGAACVVPAVTPHIREAMHAVYGQEVYFVSHESEHGLQIRYHPPASLGADRLCNAVAARARFGGAAIAIDFGTATKLEVVTEYGEYLGGAILPGIGISLDALYARTAQLAEVALEAPPSVIGDNTVHALQSGIVYGYAGQADALIDRMCDELDTAVGVVVTGGWAHFLAHRLRTPAYHDPMLTLDGVRRICVHTLGLSGRSIDV
jgi:type III pantothenate kinase